MLQPMQPIGQQQKPGTNIGMPKAPGQQMLPAGLAMSSGILPGGIASNPEDIKAAYGGTPQGQQRLQQAAGQGDYLSAIALSQILEEEREKKASMAAPQGGKPQPVVDRMRDEAVQLRRQDLEEQQAKRLGMEQQRSQSAMAQMASQAGRPQMPGVAGLPAPNVAQPQAMAAGGIVAFAEGDVVEKPSEEEVRPVGANPYAGLSNRQIVERYGREQLGADRSAAERRAREEYMRFAGYTPEEKAAREKRIAEMEEYDRKMYAPEKLNEEGLIAALAGGAGYGSIGQVLGSVGRSGLNYDNKMRELARQRMADRQRQAEAWDEAQHGARVKGYEAGVTEGKDVIAGQRAGIAGLGDVLKADAAAARIAAGGGAGNKALEDASQAVARDRQIQGIEKYIKDNALEPGSEEYNKYSKMAEDRARAIYKSFNAPYPDYPQAEIPQTAAPEKTGILAGLGNLWKGITSGAQRLQSGESAPQTGAPAGMPADAKFIGYAKGTTKRVYQTPDGKMWTEQ